MKKPLVFLVGFITGSGTIVAGAVSAVMFFFCPATNPGLVNLLLFRPLQEFDEQCGAELHGIKATEISIASTDGIKLHGRLYSQKNADQIVLYNHGQGGNISMPYCSAKVESLLSTGASVLSYDYRGFGKSGGTPTIDGVVDDAKAAFDYIVKNTCFKKEQIIVYGESLGTGVSSALCRTIECGGVVLESGFISPEAIGKEKFDLFRAYPSSLFPSQFNNDRFVQGEHPPLLIIAGKLDRLIPWQHSKFLFEHARKPTELAVFDKCGHASFQAQKSEFNLRLKKFFHDCASRTSCRRDGYRIYRTHRGEPIRET